MKCPVTLCAFLTNSVAPVRERGLKSTNVYDLVSAKGRSRKGAWIEMGRIHKNRQNHDRRSRKGAWIEITSESSCMVLVISRSRKGAWIEIRVTIYYGVY